MAAISQTTLSNEFSWMWMLEFRLRCAWSLHPRVQLTNIPALLQIMAWRRPGDKPLSEAMMVSLLTHICVARPQWVNTKHRTLFKHSRDPFCWHKNYKNYMIIHYVIIYGNSLFDCAYGTQLGNLLIRSPRLIFVIGDVCIIYWDDQGNSESL